MRAIKDFKKFLRKTSVLILIIEFIFCPLVGKAAYADSDPTVNPATRDSFADEQDSNMRTVAFDPDQPESDGGTDESGADEETPSDNPLSEPQSYEEWEGQYQDEIESGEIVIVRGMFADEDLDGDGEDDFYPSDETPADYEFVDAWRDGENDAVALWVLDGSIEEGDGEEEVVEEEVVEEKETSLASEDEVEKFMSEHPEADFYLSDSENPELEGEKVVGSMEYSMNLETEAITYLIAVMPSEPVVEEEGIEGEEEVVDGEDEAVEDEEEIIEESETSLASEEEIQKFMSEYPEADFYLSESEKPELEGEKVVGAMEYSMNLETEVITYLIAVMPSEPAVEEEPVDGEEEAADEKEVVNEDDGEEVKRNLEGSENEAPSDGEPVEEVMADEEVVAEEEEVAAEEEAVAEEEVAAEEEEVAEEEAVADDEEDAVVEEEVAAEEEAVDEETAEEETQETDSPELAAWKAARLAQNPSVRFITVQLNEDGSYDLAQLGLASGETVLDAFSNDPNHPGAREFAIIDGETEETVFESDEDTADDTEKTAEAEEEDPAPSEAVIAVGDAEEFKGGSGSTGDDQEDEKKARLKRLKQLMEERSYGFWQILLKSPN